MAVKRQGQWGITFRTLTYTGGYEWKQHMSSPNIDNPKWDTLGWVSLEDPELGRSGVEIRRGRDNAWKAFNKFRALAIDLNKTDDLSDQRGLILDFAGQYGLLWGPWEPKTAQEWCTESAAFLDLYDVSQSVRRGDFRSFEERVVISRMDSHPEIETGMSYMSRYRHGFPRRIARNQLMIEEARDASFATVIGLGYPKQTDWQPSIETVRARNDFHTATEGTPRDRAMMLLAREVNRILTGGLNFVADPTKETLFTVENKQLIHLLYLRLWMRTIGKDDMDRVSGCLECGAEIEGTRRKKFCDDACRTAFHNRRRAKQ